MKKISCKQYTCIFFFHQNVLLHDLPKNVFGKMIYYKYYIGMAFHLYVFSYELLYLPPIVLDIHKVHTWISFSISWACLISWTCLISWAWQTCFFSQTKKQSFMNNHKTCLDIFVIQFVSNIKLVYKQTDIVWKYVFK